MLPVPTRRSSTRSSTSFGLQTQKISSKSDSFELWNRATEIESTWGSTSWRTFCYNFALISRAQSREVTNVCPAPRARWCTSCYRRSNSCVWEGWSQSRTTCCKQVPKKNPLNSTSEIQRFAIYRGDGWTYCDLVPLCFLALSCSYCFRLQERIRYLSLPWFHAGSEGKLAAFTMFCTQLNQALAGFD